MSVEEIVKKEIQERGMTITAVSKKTGIPYNRLQPSLNGLRELRADEFLELCSLLCIDPNVCRKTTGD